MSDGRAKSRKGSTLISRAGATRGREEDADVEPQALVVEIPRVKLELAGQDLCPVLVVGIWPVEEGSLIDKGKLCEPSDPRLGSKHAPVERVRPVDVAWILWPRTHERHIAAKHVPKLRDLVELRAPQNASQPCDAGVITPGHRSPGGIGSHRANLQHPNRPSASADADGMVEQWPWVMGDQHRESHEWGERQRDEEEWRRNGDVKRPLSCSQAAHRLVQRMTGGRRSQPPDWSARTPAVRIKPIAAPATANAHGLGVCCSDGDSAGSDHDKLVRSDVSEERDHRRATRSERTELLLELGNADIVWRRVCTQFVKLRRSPVEVGSDAIEVAGQLCRDVDLPIGRGRGTSDQLISDRIHERRGLGRRTRQSR